MSPLPQGRMLSLESMTLEEKNLEGIVFWNVLIYSSFAVLEKQISHSCQRKEIVTIVSCSGCQLVNLG